MVLAAAATARSAPPQLQPPPPRPLRAASAAGAAPSPRPRVAPGARPSAPPRLAVGGREHASDTPPPASGVPRSSTQGAAAGTKKSGEEHRRRREAGRGEGKRSARPELCTPRLRILKMAAAEPPTSPSRGRHVTPVASARGGRSGRKGFSGEGSGFPGMLQASGLRGLETVRRCLRSFVPPLKPLNLGMDTKWLKTIRDNINGPVNVSCVGGYGPRQERPPKSCPQLKQHDPHQFTFQFA
ncbi:atherin-like [Homo sapiens]|uniref:atherin-like n=1 Tax=Homo sapiens TaxID=9606 RepID=UPI001FB139DF|nr:atherin-like [Homo sapiens]